MHNRPGMNNLSAKGLAYRLVPQTHTQYRQFTREIFYRFNREDNAQARANYQQSIDIEASSIAYAMLGFAHLIDLMYGWSDSQMESFDKANNCAESAYGINENVDILHMLLGWIYLFKGMHDKAVLEGKRSIQLNPNGAEAHVHLGILLVFLGNPDDGNKHRQLCASE